jgi:hypothetical protein
MGRLGSDLRNLSIGSGGHQTHACGAQQRCPVQARLVAPAEVRQPHHDQQEDDSGADREKRHVDPRVGAHRRNSRTNRRDYRTAGETNDPAPGEAELRIGRLLDEVG